MNSKIEALEKQLAVEKFKVALEDALSIGANTTEIRLTPHVDDSGNGDGPFTISIHSQQVTLTKKQVESLQDFIGRLVDASLTDALPKERRRKSNTEKTLNAQLPSIESLHK